MRLKENPEIPEGINASQDNHFSEFALLLLGVSTTVVVAVLLIAFSAQYFARMIPFAWEQQLTQFYVQAQVDTEPQPVADIVVDAEQALNDLGENLLEHLDVPTGMSFTFHYLDEWTPNAFATLGGHIFITYGLLQQVSSENALAMVLAHEMAHVIHRHPVQALGRGAVIQLVLFTVIGGEGASSMQSILGQAGLLTLLSFNRDMEREADSVARAALLSYYGHLQGADEFFVKMQQQSGSEQWLTVFQTHPGVDERITAIKQSADREGGNTLVALDDRLLRLTDSSQK